MEFVKDGSRCEVELVEQEGVGVNDLDVERWDACRWEVGGVERDDPRRVRSQCSGEDMAVLRVARELAHQGSVPGEGDSDA